MGVLIIHSKIRVASPAQVAWRCSASLGVARTSLWFPLSHGLANLRDLIAAIHLPLILPFSPSLHYVGPRWLPPSIIRKITHAYFRRDQASRSGDLEAGKDKISSRATLILAQGNRFWTSDPHNCHRRNVCCFKPQRLWEFVTEAIGN